MDTVHTLPTEPDSLGRYLADVGVRLPLREDPEHFGVLQDSDGRDVVTIDVNAERTDEDVAKIGAAILIALDTVGSLVSANAARDVLMERRRQIHGEGWTAEHDDAHREGSLAAAAACYASIAAVDDRVRDRFQLGSEFAAWPWEASWWRPKDRRADLVRAGALIIAEIERLDRAAEREREGGQ